MAFVIEKFGLKCHTLDRFDVYRCYQREALRRYREVTKISQNDATKSLLLTKLKDDLKQLNEYIDNKWQVEHLNLIQDNDECMKDHSAVSQYW